MELYQKLRESNKTCPRLSEILKKNNNVSTFPFNKIFTFHITISLIFTIL